VTIGDVDKVIVGEVSIGEVIETREICLYAAAFVNYN
jgi:hypothetical protein